MKKKKAYGVQKTGDALIEKYGLFSHTTGKVKPQSNLHKNQYIKTEAYLQHTLFRVLRNKGIEVIPEVTDGHNRYDLLILKDNKPICIVEIKSSRGGVDMDQLAAYERNSFGVPVYCMAGFDMFHITLDDILKLFPDQQRLKKL